MDSCKKEEFSTDGNAKLEFSQDTIIFDTVFTQVGSSTEVFTVYNRKNQAIKISSIRLASGMTSNYRLNVDGVPGKSFEDVEIAAEDSLFIFVEVTVDPNNTNTPLIVSDSILFETNGNLQDIDLVAWGQDAYFHPSHTGGSPLFFLDCNDVWNNDKPHVIYGYALVDSGCTLTINAGTNVHFHPGSGIIVLSSGTLKVNGTLTEPVTIQGDRLGQDYKDVAGQWDRIWLSNITRSNLINGTTEIGPGSRNSEIKYAIIKNGNIGLHVDTVFASTGETTLRIENTIVKNMAGNGLYFRGAVIKAFNCVFANCGYQTAALLYGGRYDFYQCTFANFWVEGNRQDPAVLLNNYFGVNVRQLDASFYNSIIYGNLDTELGLDSFPNAAPGRFNFRFDHALMKLDNSFPHSNPANYNAIISGASIDPRFKDIDNNIYEIDSTSVAVDAGDPSFLSIDPVLNFDLNGNVRPQSVVLPLRPDLGAYERR
ncbi:MAG: hypothetical protein IPQ03_07260 [Bacteroidetes bacterium]|nr:hypothetical protein [Bacteroidota bacterium]MBP6403164.1 hypothetical protein [Bacteroidia bacterium]MBK9524880.1 hypothetical protein [Bacteroidota bacterium]MBK9543046.1 hypothetical protein [Bacteroidota bacterium]MBL0257324.1 hypothetical protein [Bacteroidota bacterium]